MSCKNHYDYNIQNETSTITIDTDDQKDIPSSQCGLNKQRNIFFDPRDLDLKIGDHVLVETSRGIEYGEVVSERKDVSKKDIYLPIKPILRLLQRRIVLVIIRIRVKKRKY